MSHEQAKRAAQENAACAALPTVDSRDEPPAAPASETSSGSPQRESLTPTGTAPLGSDYASGLAPWSLEPSGSFDDITGQGLDGAPPALPLELQWRPRSDDELDGYEPEHERSSDDMLLQDTRFDVLNVNALC
jgi:hypothetical protein